VEIQFANSQLPERNLENINDLLGYLGCANRTNRFVEGNVYILSKKIVDILFVDKKLYNILNGPDDFDYNWARKRYGLSGSLNDIYNEFERRQLTPRDRLSYDGYTEHAFERVILNCIDDDKIKVVKRPKVCIIYVYYERKNEQKNQTNLSFFIKYGLDKSRWRDIDITTLFIINGHQCEVLIPQIEDIFVLKEDNCSDWEGWYNGIKYFENKYKKPIYESFSHLCLINASSFGPVYEDSKDRHWLDPFFNKMSIGNSIACSPCINYLQNTDAGGPGPRLVPHFSLIRIDKTILRLLTQTLIYPTAEGSIQKSYINYPKNTILGKKRDKIDAALTGEYGLSRILLKYNFNINCLVKYGDETINLHIDKVYKEENNKGIIFKQIFVKNIWRGNKQIRYSLPYFYNNIYAYINSTLNYKNIFSTNNYDYNYELLDIDKSGKLSDIDGRLYSKYEWNTKKDFYSLYGYSEEFVLWPKIINRNESVVIYCHYDANNIIKDYVIISLKTLMILGYDIIFCTTSNSINNIDLPFKINYYKNSGRGTDWVMWVNEMKKLSNNKSYEYVLLINDSLLFPIHGIENMSLTIKELRNSSDYWGLWESNEEERHIVGTPVEFKYKLLDKIIYFIKKQFILIKKPRDYIMLLELKIVNYLRKQGYICTALSFFDVRKYGYCPSCQPLAINTWIKNEKYFAIKWKYVANYLSYNELNNDYLNYLLRYLKTGDKIPNIPNYF